jgi:hypothetical protein
MTSVVEIPIVDWHQPCPGPVQERALRALEEGGVLYFPQLAFPLGAGEQQFLSPAIAGKSKNVSFDIRTGKVRGSSVDEVAAEQLHGMMQRYANFSNILLDNLLPQYKDDLVQSRTSYRPVQITGRATSWRKDDTRLHVDSFPATPVQGNRILRVFTNVNPNGQPRAWRLGESFEAVARRYLPSLPRPLWGTSALLRLLKITKSCRSAYDHFMLQLHDGMKANLAYQKDAPQIAYDFPPGSTWMVYTDQVSHAAMGGQYLFEQTYYLPVSAMRDQAQAPLRILERLTERALV